MLRFIAGRQQGREIPVKIEQELVIGRAEDADLCIDEDTVSRKHATLFVKNDEIVLRDCSKNGTYVNGRKHGGRPAEAAVDYSGPLPDPEVELCDRDTIKVGDTELNVLIELDAVCTGCGNEIAAADKQKAALEDGNFICSECRRKIKLHPGEKMMLRQPAAKREVKCALCGQKISDEEAAKEKRHGDVICSACRDKAKSNPEDLVEKIIQELIQNKSAEAPQLPDYEIIKKLGEGGMGAVFLAQHKKTGHKAAVKIILPKVAASETAVKHFQREAHTTAELKHRNIVEFYEQGYANGVFYIAMEFLEGGDLWRLIAAHRGRVPVPVAGPIMVQCLEGLAYAHAQGFVHRDLKPPNVLLGGSPQNPLAKISDFGLAKNFQEAGLSGYTATGNFTGTYVYMAPDQITNYKYSQPPVDVYSIGVTFYQLLTGEFPLEFIKGKDPLLVILQDPVVSIKKRNPKLPQSLADVIDKAVAKEPGQRYKDAGEMLKAMKKVL